MASSQKSKFVEVGDKISAWTADLFAHPGMQIGVVVFCIGWFVLGLKTDLLTAALSILAITLTQMVLNSQKERECDDFRRDVALHAKIDELLIAMKGARSEMAGIEELDVAEIVELKDNAQDHVDALDDELDERGEIKSVAKAAAT
jgi:low affinity Fe/Cu permease